MEPHILFIAILASIANILSFFWLISFGSRTLHQVFENWRSGRPVRNNVVAPGRSNFIVSIANLFFTVCLLGFVVYAVFQPRGNLSANGTRQGVVFTATPLPTSTRGTTLMTPSPSSTPQATVTPTTPQQIYNQVTTNERPAHSDALSSNDKKNWNWLEYNNPKDSACEFTGGAYHGIALLPGYKYICPAYATHFSNFVFQVQMMIIKGDCGGLFFRANSDANKYYYFQICQDGSYTFFRYDKPGNETLALMSSSPAIKQGLNQSNLIAALAEGSNIYLYVNSQYIYGVNDSTYTEGQIGVASASQNTPTEVIFSNVEVWSL